MCQINRFIFLSAKVCFQNNKKGYHQKLLMKNINSYPSIQRQLPNNNEINEKKIVTEGTNIFSLFSLPFENYKIAHTSRKEKDMNPSNKTLLNQTKLLKRERQSDIYNKAFPPNPSRKQ